MNLSGGKNTASSVTNMAYQVPLLMSYWNLLLMQSMKQEQLNWVRWVGQGVQKH